MEVTTLQRLQEIQGPVPRGDHLALSVSLVEIISSLFAETFRILALQGLVIFSTRGRISPDGRPLKDLQILGVGVRPPRRHKVLQVSMLVNPLKSQESVKSMTSFGKAFNLVAAIRPLSIASIFHLFIEYQRTRVT